MSALLSQLACTAECTTVSRLLLQRSRPRPMIAVVVSAPTTCRRWCTFQPDTPTFTFSTAHGRAAVAFPILSRVLLHLAGALGRKVDVLRTPLCHHTHGRHNNAPWNIPNNTHRDLFPCVRYPLGGRLSACRLLQFSPLVSKFKMQIRKFALKKFHLRVGGIFLSKNKSAVSRKKTYIINQSASQR